MEHSSSPFWVASPPGEVAPATIARGPRGYRGSGYRGVFAASGGQTKDGVMVGGALCDRYVPAWTGATGTAGTGVGPAQNGAGMATRSGSTSHAGGSTGQAPASGPAAAGGGGRRRAVPPRHRAGAR